jgi:hypothetical protein
MRKASGALIKTSPHVNCIQVGARSKASRNGLKSSLKAGAAVQDEELVDRALRIMHRSVQLIFAEEPLVASSIEIDQSGLLSMLEASRDPLDPKECVHVVARLITMLLPLVTKGELASRFPAAPRGRKNPECMLFRRNEMEVILTAGPRENASLSPDRPPQRAIRKLPPIESNEHGIALAQSLIDQRPAEAKMILFRKLVHIITPQLSWNKNAGAPRKSACAFNFAPRCIARTRLLVTMSLTCVCSHKH